MVDIGLNLSWQLETLIHSYTTFNNKTCQLGIIIATDLKKSYFGLTTSSGKHHFTENKSKIFVDPISSENTKTMASSWRAVKWSLKTGIKQNKNV